MEEKLKVGDRAVTVRARLAPPGRLRLDVDGAAEELRVVASSPGHHLVELGGALEPLHVVRAAVGTWVWHRGRARLVEAAAPERGYPDALAEERRGAPSTAATAPRSRLDGTPPAGPPGSSRPGAAALPPGAVTPPMPSVVLAVLVEEGEVVARGQPLVVVSAMKTESELVAPFAGTVRAVAARAGAKVRPGDVLVQVDAEGAPHGG